MTYKFLIDNEKLIACGNMDAKTGNVNTYTCEFDIRSENDKLLWFCVFKTADASYVVPIEDKKCRIPFEVLQKEGTVDMGCYAIGNDESGAVQQVSTGFVQFAVSIGAYCDANTPEVPEHDVWATIALKAVPIVGENGNWYVYDIATDSYIDSDCTAIGEDGYTPKRGTDYWTNGDKAEIKAYIDECTAEIDEKEEKTQIVTDDVSKNYIFEFLANEIKEVRLGVLESLSFTFSEGEYSPDYVSGISFDSGDSATAVDYTNSGILNWLGKDCATKEGVSIFEPSKNTHYDIVLYFNGKNMVGMVNGFSVSGAQSE